MAIEGEAMEDRSLALPRGVGGNRRFGVASVPAYGGRGRAGDASLGRECGGAIDVPCSADAAEVLAMTAADDDGDG